MSESATTSRKRKRAQQQQPGWKDLPGFLDASASVSAATFGARRLPELEQLLLASSSSSSGSGAVSTRRRDQTLQSGGAKTSCRHLRRRTTAIQTRRHAHRFPNNENHTRPESKSSSRRARRQNQSTLFAGHLRWQNIGKSNADGDDLATDATKQSTNPNWMTTHLWHAKRFYMDTMWGWRTPLAHTNRGARAILRLENEDRCSLQDVTWQRQAISMSSTQPSLSTLIQCLRRICPVFGSDKATLCGSQMGDSVLYHKDQFPSKAVGPAWWRISQIEKGKAKWLVQFWVHPSIRPVITTTLQELINETDSGLGWEEEIQQTCCFRLCGSSATKILDETLRLNQSGRKRWAWEWELLQNVNKGDNENDESVVLPHGSIVCADVVVSCIQEGVHNDKVVQSGPAEARDQNTIQEAIEAWTPESILDGNNLDTEWPVNKVMLVRLSPRPLDCSANRAVSGWDVYVHPAMSKELWMALALQGSCCAIGMVEESHLRLDCNPPLTVFPRDFVDTEQGILYWHGNDPNWKVVRKLYEGGWGRLPVQKDVKLSKVRWESLVCVEEPSSASLEKSSQADLEDVVVVRGAFGQPFVDILAGCGHLPSVSDGERKRRNRRKSRPLNQVIRALQLSSDQVVSLRQTCKSLRASLSLPAVLTGSIRINGTGQLAAGSQVWFSDVLLGQATAGMFSLTRGTCHGIAVVGAAPLLHALSSTRGDTGRVVRSPNGSLEVQLLVTVQNGTTKSSGTMSLIV